MSCHDGSVAVDSYYGASGNHPISNGANTNFGAMPKIESDGMKTHPIGFDFAALDTAGTDTHLWPSLSTKAYLGNDNTVTIGERLFQNQYFTCSTCHDVHNKLNQTAGAIKSGTQNYFLLGGQLNSGLCISCHTQAASAREGIVPVIY
jgi:mono/diheme cytochrome c family protein